MNQREYITAPEDIAFLEGRSPAKKEYITDPDLIAQLEGKKPSKIPGKQRGFGSLLNLHTPRAEEEKTRRQVLGNLGKGALSALEAGINTPATIGNVFNLGMPKVNLVEEGLPKTIGEIVGSIPTAIGPGAFTRSLPAIQAGLHGLRNAPLMNALVRTGGRGAEAALFGAAMNPENKLHGAEFGGGLGAGASTLSQLLRTRNPFISLLAKLGVGAGLGYPLGEQTGYDGKTGAGLGVAAMFGAPRAARELGFGPPPGTELLEHVTPEQVRPALEAAQRLRTRITPSEATGNPVIGGQEGRFGKTGEAATYRARAENIRYGEQERAINRTLNTIFNEKDLGPEVSKLYKAAYNRPAPISLLTSIKMSPLLEKADQEVATNPVYQDLIQKENIKPNSYQYLDLVKRRLSDIEEGFKNPNGTATEQSRIAGQTRKEFADLMKKYNPDYEKATELAQRKITRREIETALANKKLTGKNFYDKILSNRISYNQLNDKLKNVPEAQQQLKDMRLAWEFLSNPEKPRSAAYRSQSSLDQNRNTVTDLIDKFYGLFGHQSNVEALRMIYNPKWNQQFEEVKRIKNIRERNDKLAGLLSRYAAAAGIEIESKKK